MSFMGWPNSCLTTPDGRTDISPASESKRGGLDFGPIEGAITRPELAGDLIGDYRRVP